MKSHLPSALSDAQLDGYFNAFWPELKEKLKEVEEKGTDPKPLVVDVRPQVVVDEPLRRAS